MQLAIVGLGRMGGNISRRLIQHGHEVVVYDANPKAIDALAQERATPSTSLADTVKKLAGLLQKGDTIIDGGNSFYRDDIRRAKTLAKQGLHYVDCGTSGG